jgi:hypothetical protein
LATRAATSLLPLNCGPVSRTCGSTGSPSPPVTPITQERGERVYPAWRWLASETSHIESEAGEHNLNVLQAIRPMDEVMAANFTAFHGLVSDKRYDLCHLAMLEGVPRGDETMGLEPVTDERYQAASEN